jgi:hypothetical protein
MRLNFEGPVQTDVGPAVYYEQPTPLGAIDPATSIAAGKTMVLYVADVRMAESLDLFSRRHLDYLHGDPHYPNG